MLLPGVGSEGQARLARGRALVIGCGALGTVVCDWLARAGVGQLTMVDRDVVEWTNLQRQTLYDEADARAGTPKAEAAAKRLLAINSDVRVDPGVVDVNPRSVLGLCENQDVVVDATDNFQTRYLLNDACVKLGLPLVYGGAVGLVGMNMTILPGESACLRCVFPEPPDPGSTPTCDTVGVLGPLVGIIASVQAAQALRVLLGDHAGVDRCVRQVELATNTWRKIHAERDPYCPCCAMREFRFLDTPAQDLVSLCGSDAVQIIPASGAREWVGGGEVNGAIDLERLEARLRGVGATQRTRFMLRVRLETEGLELSIFRDARAIIRGTQSLSTARSIYARFVGG